VGLFALSGFQKGWWREAIVTLFLAILVFLLRVPGVAQALIDFVNQIFAFIWGILPESVKMFLMDFVAAAFGITPTADVIQADASSGQTWLIILMLIVAIATLIGWVTLPHRVQTGRHVAYVTNWFGSILGGLVGGFNGLLVINLVREYLEGSNLPGGGSSLPSEMTMAASGSVGVASSGVSLQATQLPSFTVLDSFLPWIITLMGVLFILAVFRNRIAFKSDKEKFRTIIPKAPFGYDERPYVSPPPKP
jgi:hypothetical protein